jgi:tetratricopeptide (TPR) repeat protein
MCLPADNLRPQRRIADSDKIRSMRTTTPPSGLRPFGRDVAGRQAIEAAIAAIGAGNLDDAVRRIEGDPAAVKTPIGQNILGDVHLKRGNPREALKAFDAALKASPRMPEAHCNRAAALQELGKFEEALAAADRALKLRPQYATALFNRGNALKELRRFEEAQSAYSRALTLRPSFPEVYLNRGHVRVALGKWLDALSDFTRVVNVEPANVGAHVGRASAYRGLHDMKAAFLAIDAASALEPESIEVALIRVDTLISAERHEEALAAADAAVVLAPESSQAHAARANALGELKRREEALAAADEAVRLASNAPGAHVARASALLGLGRSDEAVEALRTAETYGAAGVGYLHAKALAMSNVGKHDEALVLFERAVDLEPKNASLRYNRSFMLLTLGRFEEGWREHEWRLARQEKIHGDKQAIAPQWRGENLSGKKLLVYGEQGHGDAIQFTRYLPMVAERCGSITLQVPEAIRRLYEANFPDVDVTAQIAMRSGFDYQVSLMSLPFVFGTTLETVPRNIPYLRADPARVAKWGSRLGGDGFKVGIVWQGNPKYQADRERSFAVSEFAPVADVEGVRLISLQWTGGAEQLLTAGHGMKVETLGEEIVNNPDGFREVAAVMANLDLLIMSDTGPAHLAGALGRPVWVALTKRPDWRWMREGTTTPWYPTMRLFRQKTRGDWPGVFAEIATELTRLIEERRAA